MNVQTDITQFDVRSEEHMLTRLEWRVVSLALREAGECGCANVVEPSALRRFLGKMLATLTGWKAKMPLADPRLETLRRFVCLSTWRHKAAAEFAEKLVDLGFSRAQVRAVALLAGR